LIVVYRAFTSSGRPFHAVLLTKYFPQRSPTTPYGTPYGLASSAFARHYLRNHYCFLFLLLLRCFSSEGSRLLSPCLQHGGLPHSDICGSRVVCTSPQLFAAYHVLRRLREPRHPPYALISLPTLLDPYESIYSWRVSISSALLGSVLFNTSFFLLLCPNLSMNFLHALPRFHSTSWL
jgi:hypothetical protein